MYGWTGIVRALSLKAGPDGHLLWPPVTKRVCRCNCPWGADEVVCWFVLSPGSTEKHDIFMKKTDFVNFSWWKGKHMIHFYIFKCIYLRQSAEKMKNHCANWWQAQPGINRLSFCLLFHVFCHILNYLMVK